FQINLVDSSDLQLPSLAGLDRLRHVNHRIRIKVQAHYCIVTFGMFRFLLNGDDISISVKFGYPIPLRIIDIVTEYRCLLLVFYIFQGSFQELSKAVAIKNIVT